MHRNQETEWEAETGNSPSASVLVLIISNLVVNDESCSYHYRSGTEPVYCALGQCGLGAYYVCISTVFPAALF